jgi:hypothetical protein
MSAREANKNPFIDKKHGGEDAKKIQVKKIKFLSQIKRTIDCYC